MPFPAQTFTTIQQLISYINQFIIPNGVGEIDGSEHNNVENALANFIVTYTLNNGLVSIEAGSGIITLAAPITVLTGLPTSVKWVENVQNEYYIINATGFDIPITNGYSYIDAFQAVQTTFPARAAIHIAKMSNAGWLQINNLGGSSGSLPPQSTHGGQVLFTTGASPFWGDPVMQIAADDPNWVNATTWQNGFAVNNPSFSSSHFLLLWNDLSRFLLQSGSPPEWQYVPNGFEVLLTPFDAQGMNVNMFLFFKGENS